jgi:hypothetical protein
VLGMHDCWVLVVIASFTSFVALHLTPHSLLHHQLGQLGSEAGLVSSTSSSSEVLWLVVCLFAHLMIES